MLEFGFQLGCLIHTYIVELAVCIRSLTCAKLDFHWTFWNSLLHKLESVCTLSLSNQVHARVYVQERETDINFGYWFLIALYALITVAGIGGTRFISFEDRHWHNDCFICASCKTSLVGRGFITDAEDIICPECAKQKLMWTATPLWSSYIWLTWKNKIVMHL